MKNETGHNITDKKSSKRRYLLAAGIIFLLIISALVVSLFQQEPKPDPASEKIIREAAALHLKKDPNELTDEDFAKITEITELDLFVVPKFYDQPIRRLIVDTEISDISLLEKFTNLQVLYLHDIHYPVNKIPKWMKFLEKLCVFDLEERFAIDLNPIKNLTSLKTLRLSKAQISDITPLKGLANLEVLFIDNTRASDLEPLRGLANLQTLSISETQVYSLDPIKNLKKLRKLFLTNCRNITDEQIKELKISMPDLIIIKDYVQ